MLSERQRDSVAGGDVVDPQHLRKLEIRCDEQECIGSCESLRLQRTLPTPTPTPPLPPHTTSTTTNTCSGDPPTPLPDWGRRFWENMQEAVSHGHGMRQKLYAANAVVSTITHAICCGRACVDNAALLEMIVVAPAGVLPTTCESDDAVPLATYLAVHVSPESVEMALMPAGVSVSENLEPEVEPVAVLSAMLARRTVHAQLGGFAVG